MKDVEQFEGIAIIGMAGRFPGAPDVASFWQNLRHGVEAISFFSDEDLLAAGVSPSLFKRPDYVRANGVLEGKDLSKAQATMNSTFSLIDRAAKWGIIKKNTAARYKSRLTLRLRKLAAA